MNEVWKNIANYEGLYQVSNLGKIKSLSRSVNGTLGGTYLTKERFLNPRPYTRGYRVVKLYTNGKAKRVSIHVLVATAFIPNPHKKPVVNHKDGNKENNHSANLEWVTDQENHTHAALAGLKAKGETHGFSKLNNEAVRKIKTLLKSGVSQRKIAAQFSVCQASIKDINKGTTWKHIK
jgi:hypothetical protein